MRKFLVALIALPLAAIGQIRYEKGYFIDNSGSKTECLIRNPGWEHNPVKFEYMLDESGQKDSRSIENTREFGIYEDAVYVRENVAMERSTSQLRNLPVSPKYKLENERHFLRILVSGKSSLYSYGESGLVKFFFTNKDGKIEQLIYIPYLNSGTSQIRHLNQFHSQILTLENCPGVNLTTISTLKYKEDELKEFFAKMSDCKGEKQTVSKVRKGKFQLKPMIGIGFFKLETPQLNSAYDKSAEFSKVGFTYGVEAEFILPSNRNKLAILLDVNYNTFKDGKDLPDGASITDLRQDFKFASLHVPFGVRYYMYLSDKTKLFVNPLVAANFFIGDNYALYHDQTKQDFAGTTITYGFGAGISVGAINAEVRLMSPQGLTKSLGGDFYNTSLMLSYNLL